MNPTKADAVYRASASRGNLSHYSREFAHSERDVREERANGKSRPSQAALAGVNQSFVPHGGKTGVVELKMSRIMQQRAVDAAASTHGCRRTRELPAA